MPKPGLTNAVSVFLWRPMRPEPSVNFSVRPSGRMVNGASEMTETFQESQAARYRPNAETLRRLAAEIRFDFCRRQQLLALADGFDRFAQRRERSPLKEAAD